MNSEHFDQIAAQYDAALPAHVTQHYLHKRVRLLERELLPLSREGGEATVLDVGCGTGRLVAALSARRLKVLGADSSPGMLQIASQRLRRASQRLRRASQRLRRASQRLRRASEHGGCVTRASSVLLPFADGTFDGTYCVALLHHLRDPEVVARTLSEMVRVLRRGGRVIVWDHNPANPYWPVIMKKVPQDTGEERLVPADEIVAALRACGAADVRVMKSGFVAEFVPRSLMPLAAALERLAEALPLLRRLAAHNVVIAEKPDG
jgi:ubiquinone/menaquinone biosynthesis C-methylase UbiE